MSWLSKAAKSVQNAAGPLGTAALSAETGSLLTGATLLGNKKSSGPSAAGSSSASDPSAWNSYMGDVPYASSPAVQQVLEYYRSDPNQQKAYGYNDTNLRKTVSDQVKEYGNMFQQQFNNFVGRDPTADEYNQFFQTVVMGEQPWKTPFNATQARQDTTGFLNQTYQQTAQQEAQKKLQDQATAAVAPGSAFDTWQKQYTQSANDLQSNLIDYQSRLMDKIRPQLITSLQSQGLLNSGALNETFAGATTDMTNAAGQAAASAKAQAAQDIANQRFGIMSNPSNVANQFYANSVPNLQGTGQNALNQVYQNYSNLNSIGAQGNIQQNLLNQQYANQPSVLQQLGGQLAGGFVSNAGKNLANSIF